MNIRRNLDPMLRRGLAVACFVATVVAALNPVLLKVPFANREGLGKALTANLEPPGYYPDFPQFLADVRGHTRRGDRIALFVPATTFRDYNHPFLRATYLLAGREVLPAIAPDDQRLPQVVATANYLALWGVPADKVPGQTVMQQHRGRLVRVR